MNISTVSGAIICFSCALDTTGAIDWLVEMDNGELGTAEESDDAFIDGIFLVLIPSAPTGRRNIACVRLADGQSLNASLSFGAYNELMDSLVSLAAV
jgi:hypothetical protein